MALVGNTIKLFFILKTGLEMKKVMKLGNTFFQMKKKNFILGILAGIKMSIMIGVIMLLKNANKLIVLCDFC
jgi:hypothetical protein